MQLRKIRFKKGLTIHELSKISEVPKNTIEDIEKRGSGRVTTLYTLARAMGVTLDELYEE